jgi:hypothetical protein
LLASRHTIKTLIPTVGITLVIMIATPAQAQQWQLTLISKGDSMYTDLGRIERVAPHVYRAWSKYVYVKRADVRSDAKALVQKEYDCQQGTRRVVSAVFYNADGAVTWQSKEPGPWTPVTLLKGRRQWQQVCTRVDGLALSDVIRWLKITLRGLTS